MKTFVANPLFLVGLAIRLILIGMLTPLHVQEWYLPFLSKSLDALTLDPWSIWLAHSGTPIAFPYGYIMWLCFAPLLFMCKLAGVGLTWGYNAVIIGADIGVLYLLRTTHPRHQHALLISYWLSPIVIVASYILGFNDLIPVLWLTASLYLLKKHRFGGSGFVAAAAVSAKLSMGLAIPFFLIYLANNRRMRQFIGAWMKGFLLGCGLLLGTFVVLSPAGVSMLLSNPEMPKIYRFAIDFGSGATIYVVPLVYLLTVYIATQIKRLNFELFQVFMGIAFLLVVLLTPASPGWFIWVMPLLAIYELGSDRSSTALAIIFSALYVLSSALLIPQVRLMFDHAPLPMDQTIGSLMDSKGQSLVHTAMVAMGLILAAKIWREAVARNDFFRLGRKPFVIGIAGDSGSGKDTLAEALKGIFGNHSVTHLSGDGYHLWDRQKPIWQVMTHLNPMANDLEGFAGDLVSLIDGKQVMLRRYDHETGRRSGLQRAKTNDIIIASGLHALYLPILRDCYNLSIYLDIDEGLRHYFKIARDIKERGSTLEQASKSLSRRGDDAEKFIQPQVRFADLVLSVRPVHTRMLMHDSGERLRLKIVARSRHRMNELNLSRVLVGVCGLHVDMAPTSDTSEIEISIEGETSAADIALAAELICPRIFEFLDFKPKWLDGVLGVMQILTLSQINQALVKRMI